MASKKVEKKIELNDLHDELQKIRKLLILLLLSKGISEDIIDKAVEMGSANIRASYSKKAIKASMLKWEKKGNEKE